ncbi:hypothetical protein [Azospirillum sp. B21]|uniref:hypothetical protein n=1 Tax=Azospirillum sp. B21 TaxID=2607496 RepID=UPI00165FB6E1|nr:hypothetical protein [Azospirillum sp. B21]
MIIDFSFGDGLRGRTVLLVVGDDAPPEVGYNSDGDHLLTLDRAVRSIGRALFAAGARILMRPHPVYMPMLAIMAQDFREPELTEKSFVEGEGMSTAPGVAILGITEPWLRRRWPYLLDNKLITLVATSGRHHQRLKHGIAEAEPVAMLLVGFRTGFVREVNLFRNMRGNLPVIPLEIPGIETVEKQADARWRSSERRRPRTLRFSIPDQGFRNDARDLADKLWQRVSASQDWEDGDRMRESVAMVPPSLMEFAPPRPVEAIAETIVEQLAGRIDRES